MTTSALHTTRATISSRRGERTRSSTWWMSRKTASSLANSANQSNRHLVLHDVAHNRCPSRWPKYHSTRMRSLLTRQDILLINSVATSPRSPTKMTDVVFELNVLFSTGPTHSRTVGLGDSDVEKWQAAARVVPISNTKKGLYGPSDPFVTQEHLSVVYRPCIPCCPSHHKA